MLLINRAQLPLRNIKRVSYSDIEVFMGLFVVLLLIYSHFYLRRVYFDANRVNLALVMMVMRGI